jgi:hypothetical protein
VVDQWCSLSVFKYILDDVLGAGRVGKDGNCAKVISKDAYLRLVPKTNMGIISEELFFDQSESCG